jgi:hypothetical protein
MVLTVNEYRAPILRRGEAKPAASRVLRSPSSQWWTTFSAYSANVYAGLERYQLAAVALEQRATRALLERVQRAVHADDTLADGLGHARHVAGLHEREEYLELLEGDAFVDGHALLRLRGSLNPARSLT